MPKHSDRMTSLGSYIMPAARIHGNETFAKFIKENPVPKAIDKKIKQNIKKITAKIDAQLQSGTGFEVDELLRYYLQEFNNRLFMYGPTTLPASFNVIESFFIFDLELHYFRMRNEKDHLMNFVEFMDYYTSEFASENDAYAIKYFEEGVIYNFNALNDPAELTFSMKNETEFAIAGVSLVRFSSEINVILLAGEKTDLPAMTKKLRNELDKPKKIPGREMLEPAEDLDIEAVPLRNTDDFWKTIVISRFDLNDMTQNARYLFKDCGNAFAGYTDDNDAYIDEVTGAFLIPNFEDFYKKQELSLIEHQTLFELSKTALYLPMFYEEYSDSIVDERHPTKLFENIKKASWSSKKKLLDPKERILNKLVSVLCDTSNSESSNTFFSAPPIQIETSGYWKKLPLDQVGADKYGKPIHGRTWVEKVLSWVQQNQPENTVRGRRHKEEKVDAIGKNPGQIYVMRSAAHGKDIFKIGLTRRSSEIRAEELTRTTGSPDTFLVAQDWEVPDCVKAEKMIHEALFQYRINPKREFFKAPYKEIVKVITTVIAQLE